MSNYVMSDHDDDPAMRFEGLARAAFDNCAKYGDPFGIAHQEVFGFEHPNYDRMTDEFKRALVLVLVKLVVRYPDNDQLKNLEQQAWTAKTPDEVDEIIQSATSIYKSL